MGLEPRIARATIRISLGWGTTKRDVAAFREAWAHVAMARRERAVA
jgi:cysteine sulfinate desulfinase/cysteine desulfurase-like protein